MGMVQQFIKEHEDEKYDAKSDKELLSAYVRILWFANQPLYKYQLRPMLKMITDIEDVIGNKNKNIIPDLKELSDKDLIRKYKIEPKTISIKYANTDVDDIKESAKTDILTRRENFFCQLRR